VYIVHLNKKVLLGAVLTLAAIAAVIFGNVIVDDSKAVATSAGSVISLKLKNEKDRQNFLSAIGYADMGEPKEITEVLIPFDFDKVYLSYNELQNKSGLDLKKYRGKTVKKYLYQNKTASVTLLIHKDRLVGGDVTPIGEGSVSSPLFEK